MTTRHSVQITEADTAEYQFWLTSQQLASGSVVEAGTWYKIVSNTRGHSHSLMEEVYERIRSEEFPDLPSRQKSMFIFRDQSTALKFKEDNSWVHTDLYKVKITDPWAKKITLDSSLVTIGLNGQLHSTHELESKARAYWSSDNETCDKPETLVEGSIRIIMKL